MVGEHADHHLLERPVVLQPRRRPITVPHRVLIGLVCRYLAGDLLGNDLADAVRVLPVDVPELVVERLDDVAEPIQFRLRLPSAATGGNGTDLAVLVGQGQLERLFDLVAIAVHVDGFQNALRQVLLDGSRQLGDKEVQEDRQLFPVAVRVGDDRRKELVCPHERLGLPLEVHLSILVEIGRVDRNAGVEDRVQRIAVSTAEEQLDQLADLLRRVHLVAVQLGLQVVQLVRVRFLAQHGGAVVIRESHGDRVAVVHEIQYERVGLQRMRSVQAREGLHRLDARKLLVHVHRMQQGLVVAGLELLRHDEDAVRVLLELLLDLRAREPVELGLGHLLAVVVEV